MNRLISANPAAAMMQAENNALVAQANRQQMDQQNRLQQFYQQHGQGLAQGDPNAIAALGAIDPEQAFTMNRQIRSDERAEAEFGMQRERHGMAMQVDRAQLDALRVKSRTMALEQAAKLDKQTRERELAEINGFLGGAAAAYQQGPEAFDAFVQAQGQTIADNGVDPSAITYDAFPMIGAQLVGAREGLEEAQGFTEGLNPQDDEPGTVQALRIRAQEAGLEPGSTEYREFMMSGGKPPEGMILETTPDGGIRMAQGAGVRDAKFTETQSKDNVFATRMTGALETLNGTGENGEPLANSMTSRLQGVPDRMPLGIGRELQSEDYQVANQAGREFLLGLLRKDTGAAVTPQEETTYGDVYLPRPGDGERVLAAKSQARIRALEAVRSGMNAQQIAAQDRALVNAARESGEQEQERRQPQQSGPLTADQIRSMDADALALEVNPLDLDDEALDAFMEKMNGG